jgi:hypothetical protein
MDALTGLMSFCANAASTIEAVARADEALEANVVLVMTAVSGALVGAWLGDIASDAGAGGASDADWSMVLGVAVGSPLASALAEAVTAGGRSLSDTDAAAVGEAACWSDADAEAATVSAGPDESDGTAVGDALCSDAEGSIIDAAATAAELDCVAVCTTAAADVEPTDAMLGDPDDALDGSAKMAGSSTEAVAPLGTALAPDAVAGDVGAAAMLSTTDDALDGSARMAG